MLTRSLSGEEDMVEGRWWERAEGEERLGNGRKGKSVEKEAQESVYIQGRGGSWYCCC